MIDKRTKIFLIDPDENFRMACEYVINEEDQYRVVGSQDSIVSSYADLRNETPDLIIVDVAKSTQMELEALYTYKVLNEGLEILILSFMMDKDKILDLFAYGVSGYVVKNSENDFEKLLDSIDKIHQGGSPLSTAVSRLLVEELQINQDSPLSKREKDVLREMATGKPYTKIASTLHIGSQTVKSHIKSIYSKLHVHSKDEALSLAREERWI